MGLSITRRYKIYKTLRWLARVSSILSFAVLLMFVFGEEFDVTKITSSEWLGFLFFPVGLVMGFLIGWKSEFVGGFFSILSMLGFYFIHGVLVTGQIPRGFAFFIFSIPAFLFLICGIYGNLALKTLGKRVSDGTNSHEHNTL
jgi:hypothetical protein